MAEPRVISNGGQPTGALIVQNAVERASCVTCAPGRLVCVYAGCAILGQLYNIYYMVNFKTIEEMKRSTEKPKR